MNHEDIAEQNIAERYLMGKLSPDESTRFEEHFVDCPLCLDNLEATERLRAALRPLAGQLGTPATVIAWPRSAWLAAAAALILAAGGSLFFVIRVGDLQRNLEQTRIASLAWKQRYEREHAASEAAPAGPLVGSTFFLSITRGPDSDTSEPANPVTVPSDPHWVILALEGNLEPGLQSVQATLQDSTGRSVWQQSGLRVAPREALSVILPSAILRAGNYTLKLEGLQADGRYRAAGRYRFRVATP